MIKWGLIHKEMCFVKDFNTWHEDKEPLLEEASDWIILFIFSVLSYMEPRG